MYQMSLASWLVTHKYFIYFLHSPVKPVSLLRTDDVVDRVSIVSLPPRNDNGLVILSDYPIQQSQEVSPGVCTRQMKKKLTESSPSLLPKYKRSRTF